MSAEYCVHCGKPVGERDRVRVGSDFSQSGARPDLYRHPTCPRLSVTRRRTVAVDRR